MGAVPPTPEAQAAHLRREAARLGFDAVGFARAVPLDVEHARYTAFVDAGYHGTMGWLAEHAEVRRRVDGPSMLEGARTVVSVAVRYDRPAAEEAEDPPLARRIARYARGRDYHNGFRKKLRALARAVRALGTADAPVGARPLTDDAPLLERAWAARAGLGFVGKNGLVIVPGVGSMVLLGEVLTTLELPPSTPLPDRCGSCTRCLDACPTDAFPAPFVLDARRCVSYLTIEHEGPVPVALREGLGEHVFGCDDCQTVCPFNASSRAGARAASAAPAPGPDGGPRARFAPLPRWRELGLAELVRLDGAGYEALREGTPVGRPGREGLARNAALALGNAPDEAGDEALAAARDADPSPTVREAAAWALARRGLPRPDPVG